MQILSPVNIAILQNFRMQGLDHFHTDEARKEITLFKKEECDLCGAECQGANTITLTGRAFAKEHHKAFLLIVGFEPSDVTDELGANDDGDAVCPACYDQGLKVQAESNNENDPAAT